MKNQSNEMMEKYQSEIEDVKKKLLSGVSPSEVALEVFSKGHGTINVIFIFRHATGATIGELKSFGQWWDGETITDRDAFDAWGKEVFFKRDTDGNSGNIFVARF